MKFSSFFAGALSVLALGVSSASAVATPSSKGSGKSLLASLSKYEKGLFDDSMVLMDSMWNATTELIWDSPRYACWYAIGLVARNQGDDVAKAEKIFRTVVSYQYTDPTKIWYGTFADPEAPDVTTVANPLIYTNYDPNVRGFVTTSLIILLEEYEDRLSKSTVKLLEESMYNATVGDGYRVGGWYGDNLYPVYSNPWLMRCIQTSWVGHRMGDKNMTYWGDRFAQDFLSNYDLYDTLAEFNSATYAGISVYALTLWARYGPTGSVVRAHGPRVLQGVWGSLGELYNPTLKNLGGPWDRSYGYDMLEYFSVIGTHIAGLVGPAAAPLPPLVASARHIDDAAVVPLLALISPTHDALVPARVVAKLKAFEGAHAWTGNAYSPPFDYAPRKGHFRNYTAWREDGLSLGAVQINEAKVGGPAINTNAFNPAVVQWRATEDVVGWLSMYATENHISATVHDRHLSIAYPAPNATASPITKFTLVVGPPENLTLPMSLSAGEPLVLPGLTVALGGIATKVAPIVTYNASLNVNNFVYVNYTWVVPAGVSQPTLELTVEPTF